MKKNDLIAASVFLILLTGLSKITGFVREIILAYFYGASAMTDAYVTSTNIAAILIGGVMSAAALAYIPRATSARINNEDVSYMTSNLMTVCALLILLISGIAMIFSRQITWLFAMGFNEETLTLASGMLLLILPFCFVYATNNIGLGYLQSINSFWFIGVNPIITNIIIIASIAVSKGNYKILALGFALSWVVPAIWAFFLTRTKGLRYSLVFNLKDKTLQAIIISSVPIFFGQLVLQLNTLIARNFASLVGEGVISALQYADKLNQLFITLFVVSIATTLFPRFSEQVANGAIDELKETASSSINTVLIFVMPVVAGVIILAQPLVEVIYMRGAFDQNAAIVTANALAIYALGMPGFSFAEILNREFYALKDTGSPVICSVISMVINIILNFILVKRLGYIGLAASTSIAATILSILLFYVLRLKIGSLGLKHLMVNFVKMLIAVLLMALVVVFTNNKLTLALGSGITGHILTLSANAILGAVVYFIFVYALRVKEVIQMTNWIKRRHIKQETIGN